MSFLGGTLGYRVLRTLAPVERDRLNGRSYSGRCKVETNFWRRNPPCYPQFEGHLSWIYNKGLDEEPTIGATFVNGNPAVFPWQFEVIGVSSCGLTGSQHVLPGFAAI